MDNSKLGPVICDLSSTSLSAQEFELLRHPYLGGLILFSRNYESPEQITALIEAIRKIRGDLVICVDQEGGRVQRFRQGFTRLPALARLGQLYDQDAALALTVAYQCGWLMAAELLAVGVDISFAPVVDADDFHSQVIGDRAFSKDVGIVTTLATAYIQGMNGAGMVATLKHFPGHGAVRGDSHIMQPRDCRQLDQIRASDMKPFAELLPLAAGVMPAHIVFEEVDEKPVGFSPVWLKQMLRRELGFQGVIFSDDLSMAGAAAAGTYQDRANAALTAGCDAVLVCNEPEQARNVLDWLAAQNWPLSGSLASMRCSGAVRENSLAALRQSVTWLEAVKVIGVLEY